MEEMITKVEDLKSFVRATFPSIVKKNCIESSQDYFMTHLNELEEMIKDKVL